MTNPKLSKSPLVEVVFELRFLADWSNNYDYSIELSKLVATLNEYPDITPLPGSQFPARFPEPMIRHRFDSKDKKHLVNFGEFLISINTLEYSVISDFLTEIQSVLKRHLEIGGPKIVTRKGLRYINKLSFDEKFNSQNFFVNPITLPTYLKENTEGFTQLLISNFKEGKLNTRITKNPEPSEDFCFFDLDFYEEGQGEYNISNILEWINQSHEHISNTFISSLEPEFFNSLK